MLSYGFALVSDLEELSEVIKGVNRNTLGSGTLAGNPFEIDRDLITKELGFVGYSTAEFGFIRLSDAYSTGRSLIPQTRDITR